MRLAIIGVPTNSAGVSGGEAAGPSALRSAGLVGSLSEKNDVVDFGDVSIEPTQTDLRDPLTGIISPRTMLGMIRETRAAVSRAYAERRLPVVVGGDCPLLIGCLQAARDALGHGPALFFVDGHEDAYPPHGSLTGEAADMELGLAVGFTSLVGLDELGAELPIVDPHEVVLIGPRDRDEVVKDGVESIGSRVIILDDAQVRTAGIALTVKNWLDQFGHRPGRFWFHLDWDVLSSDEMPAVSYPQPGGLTWDELEDIARPVIAADHLLGVDLTIYNPDQDPDGVHARRIIAFLASVFDRPEPYGHLSGVLNGEVNLIQEWTPNDDTDQ